jgi:hypothetical protein
MCAINKKGAMRTGKHAKPQRAPDAGDAAIS